MLAVDPTKETGTIRGGNDKIALTVDSAHAMCLVSRLGGSMAFEDFSI